jgi:predicted Zn-dependent protease
MELRSLTLCSADLSGVSVTRRATIIAASSAAVFLAGAAVVVRGVSKGHRLLDAAEAGHVTVIQAAIDREPQNAGLWQLLGQAYESRKDYSHAVDAYQRSIQLSPSDEETWWMLGIAEVCRKNPPGIATVESALRRLDAQSATEFAQLAPLGCCAFGGCRE